MIVVVIIGLLAAMAVPQFQKVRAAGQDKSVVGNLRQIFGGANIYFTETGMTSANLSDIMGTDSTKYVKPISTVGG